VGAAGRSPLIDRMGQHPSENGASAPSDDDVALILADETGAITTATGTDAALPSQKAARARARAAREAARADAHLATTLPPRSLLAAAAAQPPRAWRR
jgi:hypothetical protein